RARVGHETDQCNAGSSARSRAPIVPLPAPDVPARPSRTPRRPPPRSLVPPSGVPPSAPSPSAGKLLEQRPPLVRTQASQTPALGDLELRHEMTRPHLADAGQRLEHAHNLQL